MRMIQFSLFIAIVSFTISNCGYRTAPIPYDAPDQSLPLIQLKKPVFKDDQLSIQWMLDKSKLDASTDVFYINIYDQKTSCPYCEIQPSEIISITVNDNPEIRAQEGEVFTNSLSFSTKANIYELLVDKSFYGIWRNRGLYYITANYRIKSGEISKHSNKVWPTWSIKINKPQVSILKKESIEEFKQNVIFKWNLVVEYIFRRISTTQISDEKPVYYGMNLYREDSEQEEKVIVKINDQPLMSGQTSLTIGNEKIYGCHVDRFGNESEKVLIIDNTPY